MEPTLNTLGTSAKELLRPSSKVRRADAGTSSSPEAIQRQYSRAFLPLENSLTEPYEMGEVNAGTFCESVMEKAKEFMKPDVTPSVNAPNSK